MTTVEICFDCEQPFCVECDEDATRCESFGWHCGTCGWRDCGPCAWDAAMERKAEIERDRRLYGDL